MNVLLQNKLFTLHNSMFSYLIQLHHSVLDPFVSKNKLSRTLLQQFVQLTPVLEKTRSQTYYATVYVNQVPNATGRMDDRLTAIFFFFLMKRDLAVLLIGSTG